MVKLILTDIDGVVLNWEDRFHEWMEDKGFNRVHSLDYLLHEHYHDVTEERAADLCRHFNSSGWVSDLLPYKDARTGIATFLDAGYTFIGITAMGADPYSRQLRQKNLDDVFGKGAFKDIIITSDSENKESELSQYAGTKTPWLEDKFSNAVAGHKLGLKSYIFTHKYNKEDSYSGITRVDNWAELIEYLL